MGKWHDLAKEITAIQGSPATPEAMIGVLVGCIEEGLDGIAESLERLRDATDRVTDELVDIDFTLKADPPVEPLTAEQSIPEANALLQMLHQKQKIRGASQKRGLAPKDETPSEEDGV